MTHQGDWPLESQIEHREAIPEMVGGLLNNLRQVKRIQHLLAGDRTRRLLLARALKRLIGECDTQNRVGWQP